jgi:dihydrofolate synthase/folylpolyglutamate synthase
MLETAIRAAGHCSARYTSPHLVRLEERFVVGGREVDTASLRRALGEVQRAVEQLQQAGTLVSLPTFFECATAAAFVIFRDARVDVAVLEVGLGGRLDATNVVQPIVTAITSIDFDHQAQLGDSLSSIAREKAGIVKPGVPLVCGPVPPEARRVIDDVAAERGAAVLHVTDALLRERGFGNVTLALQGRHQRDNAAVAVGVLDAMTQRSGIPVSDEAIRHGLADASWPARLERRRYGAREVLLDAAHNPAGARALASYLQEIGWTAVTLLFGAMHDKDARGMLRPLAPFCARIITTTAPSSRAASAAELAEAARAVVDSRVRVEAIDDPPTALERAAAAENPIVAAGSIFLIGPLRDILR